MFGAISFILFEDKKRAGIVALVCLCVVLVPLVIAGILAVQNQIILSTYSRVEAVVSAIGILEDENLVAELGFEYEQHQYVVTSPGYSGEWEIGTSVDILVKPSEPTKIIVLENLWSTVKGCLSGALIALIMLSAFIFHYLKVVIKEKRMVAN
ncbi:MAG: hypothetical protein QM401_04750 [Bacillota bacterium]|nr:hypothetical protein [Bacillota bacterium]